MAALERHAGALAVVLSHHDQRAAEHAGGGQVGQRIGGDVGADYGLPGHRTSRRVVDRRTQHGRGRGLVGAGLDVHAQGVEVVARLHHHVQEVRHRRALVTADIGHARLQQRLGYSEDAFAVEYVAITQFERLDFGGEGTFHIIWAEKCLKPAILSFRGRRPRNLLFDLAKADSSLRSE